ncbi:unnamed protein product [Bemisia tabaci]|uniref:Peptide transporter family 1 n=2 Tax=Bemisia tabaci TaxID=7038 RepID=A0A9N9ZZL6_BEMTA|nr:unnamed protein product [Bemisia tabaci]
MVATDAQSQIAAKQLKYPKSTFFIIGNEFCERYSYYGMRAILALYMRNVLLYAEREATIIFHIFNFLCYIFPICGGTLADAYIGQYKTIVYSSIIHSVGNVLLALAATPWFFSPRVFSLLALILVAAGAGLMKPCISTFGGQQFVLPQQAKQLATFFSIFYVSCNVGAFLSAITSPIIRQDIKCLGQQSCYPLAFGVPAILMLLALVLFICGKPWYKMLKHGGSIPLTALKCIFHGLRRRLLSNKKQEVSSHWLECVADKYDPQMQADARDVLRVLAMYIPVPMFYALYDQVGSSWIFQASKMDGVVPNWFIIKPDQLAFLNPLVCMLFIPMLELFIYPALAKIGIRRPLQYITVGAALCALSYVMAAYVEVKLEPCYAKLPSPELGQLRIFNGLPCPLELQPPIDGEQFISPLGALQRTELQVEKTRILREDLILNAGLPCMNVGVPENWTREISLSEEESVSYIITDLGGTIDLLRVPGFDDVSKSQINAPKLRVIHNFAGPLTLKSQYGSELTFKLLESDVVTPLIEVDSGTYDAMYGDQMVLSNLQIESGGVYTLVIQKIDSRIVGNLHTITPPATLHLLWMIPQKTVMSIAEVFFAMTYVSFTFTQTPAKMRSIMQSFLSMSMSLGSVVVVLVASVGFKRQAYQFLLYAGLMFLDVILLILLSLRYKYREISPSEDIEPFRVEGAPSPEDVPGQDATKPQQMPETARENLCDKS